MAVVWCVDLFFIVNSFSMEIENESFENFMSFYTRKEVLRGKIVQTTWRCGLTKKIRWFPHIHVDLRKNEHQKSQKIGFLLDLYTRSITYLGSDTLFSQRYEVLSRKTIYSSIKKMNYRFPQKLHGEW